MIGARIVGLGAVTALGSGVDALWGGALRGDVAARAPRSLALPDLPGVVVGDVFDAPAD